ncbi:MAG TPA: TetR/AcrR family transcriptional regulator [Rhizomicrobium sp.]|jgi:AcrR family transcriptional regulator
MARTQSPDYEERREAILEEAAKLYAARGFLGASIADLAAACQVSKSLVYHYYASKEDILFDVMRSHVEALLETGERIAAGEGDARQKLRALTLAFMRLYVGAAARHKVLLNELNRLPDERRRIVVDIQRKLIALVEHLLEQIRPDLSFRLARPATMLYYGMINWTHTWLDPEGAVMPDEIAELAVDVFLDGISGPPSP